MLKDCEEAMRIAEAGRQANDEEKTRWRRDGAFAVRMSVKRDRYSFCRRRRQRDR